VYAVERAVRLLFAFSAARPALGLGDLARHVGLSKSTARRLLLTLERLGLVVTDPASGAYRLGARCLELGAVAQASIDVRGRARPVMQRLVDEVGLSAYLMIPRGAEALCVETVETRRGPRILFTDVGSTFPLHAGAAPRALLAALPEPVVARALEGPLRAYTARTLTDPAAIRRDIARTRAAGYALSEEELIPGFSGIGAAIRDHQGAVAGAISIGGLKARFEPREREPLVRALIAAAAEISRALGCPAEHVAPRARPAGRRA